MRRESDFYPTPHDIIADLLEHETFEGEVWEPACGDGRIVEALQKKGVPSFGTDIRLGQNFLTSTDRATNIVTNPPYNIANEFVRHALRLADHKVAMLLQLQFLASIDRYEKIWQFHKLKSLYIYVNRIKFTDKVPPRDHAWFVWQKSHKAETVIQHINNRTLESQKKRLNPFMKRFNSPLYES